MSLAEFLRVLVSYWRQHDYCMSVKNLQAFVYVCSCMARMYFSARKQCTQAVKARIMG